MHIDQWLQTIPPLLVYLLVGVIGVIATFYLPARSALLKTARFSTAVMT